MSKISRYTIPALALTCALSFPMSVSREMEMVLHPLPLQDTLVSDRQVELIIPTYLGNEKRNYYGNEAPADLSLNWKLYLGEGETVISRKLGSRKWEGAGWTGQPLLVREDTNLILIQGSFDHNLKKINARTGEILWEYTFDDVIKGTGTLWENRKAENPDDRFVILQGSRLGVGNYLDTKHIPSYRAISYGSGRELWRLDVKWTDSYSRDVDGSALMIGDTAYIGLENSLFTILSPDPGEADSLDGMLQPLIRREIPLYTRSDVLAHDKNIVTESSPCLLNGVVYIASGSGHIYGYDLAKQNLTWDFFIGSDIDGSAVVTDDSCLIVTIEKQYIKGKGGAFKLNPLKPPISSVVWYLPTGNKNYHTWEGGIIGSAGVNDAYHEGSLPYLAAVMAMDGFLYVVDHKAVRKKYMVSGPDGIKKYLTPVVRFKDYIGPSISTPLVTGDKIVAAGYDGLKLYSYDKNFIFNKIDSIPGPFEATPVVYGKKLYVACRDGYFYCLGK